MKTIAQQLEITDFPFVIKDKNENVIYYEDSYGEWWRHEHDERGNVTSSKNSNGFWCKREYDSGGNEVYYEDSNKYWYKYEYDSDGNEIYFEDSDGIVQGSGLKIEDGFIVTHYGGLKDIVILNGVKYKRIDE